MHDRTAPADLEPTSSPPEALWTGLGLGLGLESGWSGQHTRRCVRSVTRATAFLCRRSVRSPVARTVDARFVVV